VTSVVATSDQHRALRERKVDLVLGRIARSSEEDISAEILFDERIVVVAGTQNRWTGRRKIDLHELADEAWVLPPPESPVGALAVDVFRASGVGFPLKGMARGSIHLLCALAASEPFLGVFPESLLRFGANLPPLKILPVELPIPPWPVGIMTLKNRTVSPVAQLFIDCARDVANTRVKGNHGYRDRKWSGSGH
jgi:DNA-binding transcriptional LysR family regulator